MVKLEAWRLRLRENLWLLPLVSAATAGAIGLLLSVYHPLEGSRFDRVLFSGDSDSAQTVLASVLAAVVTATSVVSSLTLVALQTASTQFSPRLLRNFVRDIATQLVLSGFVATSSLLIVLLIDVGTGSEVPRLGVTLGLMAVLASVVMIAYYFHHVSQSIRVESIMQEVMKETLSAARRMCRWMDQVGMDHAELPAVPAEAHAVFAQTSGYLQEVDIDNLWDFANDHRVVVRLVPQLGQPVTTGGAVFYVWRHDGSDPGELDYRLLTDSIGLGYERTLQHDVSLGMRQLVDMAIKAMSPAVNDPYTAMQSIDHLGTVLSRLSQHQLGDRVRCDEADNLRLAIPVVSFAELLALACDQIRRYGSREPSVSLRLLGMLRVLKNEADPAVYPALLDHVNAVVVDGLAHLDDERDRAEIQAAFDETLAWFDNNQFPELASRGGF